MKILIFLFILNVAPILWKFLGALAKAIQKAIWFNNLCFYLSTKLDVGLNFIIFCVNFLFDFIYWVLINILCPIVQPFYIFFVFCKKQVIVFLIWAFRRLRIFLDFFKYKLLILFLIIFHFIQNNIHNSIYFLHLLNLILFIIYIKLLIYIILKLCELYKIVEHKLIISYTFFFFFFLPEFLQEFYVRFLLFKIYGIKKREKIKKIIKRILFGNSPKS